MIHCSLFIVIGRQNQLNCLSYNNPAEQTKSPRPQQNANRGKASKKWFYHFQGGGVSRCKLSLKWFSAFQDQKKNSFIVPPRPPLKLMQCKCKVYCHQQSSAHYPLIVKTNFEKYHKSQCIGFKYFLAMSLKKKRIHFSKCDNYFQITSFIHLVALVFSYAYFYPMTSINKITVSIKSKNLIFNKIS